MSDTDPTPVVASVPEVNATPVAATREPAAGEFQVRFLINLDPYKRGDVLSHRDGYVFLGKGAAEPLNDLAHDYCTRYGLTPERQMEVLKLFNLNQQGFERRPD